MKLFAGVTICSKSSEITVKCYATDTYGSFYTDAKSLRWEMQMQVDVIQDFSLYVKFCRKS